MKLNLITAPVMEPVTLAELKTWCKTDIDDDDMTLNRLIVAAREYCENRTGRAFLTQTWDLVLDDLFNYEIRLPRPPCQSITSFNYIDMGGNVQPYTAFIGTTGSPARIMPNYGTPWPIYRPTIQSI